MNRHSSSVGKLIPKVETSMRSQSVTPPESSIRRPASRSTSGRTSSRGPVTGENGAAATSFG